MFWFFTLAAIGLVATAAIYWRWRASIDADLAEGAALEWAHYQRHEPDFVAHLDEAAFKAIYIRVNEPRFPGYALATLVSFFMALPAVFILLSGALWLAGETGIIPEPVDVARQMNLEGGTITILGKDIDEQTRYEAALYYIRDLAGFYYFFGVLLSWLLIVAFFMRRYHRRRPGYLRDEIIRARG